MTITPQPESLCLTGNMASIRVTTDTDITMTLTSGNDELLTHTYSPTADNIVDINLRDIVLSLLSFDLKNQSTPYQQTMICRSFTVTLTDGTDTETVSFKALRAGVDNLSDTVGNFLQHNFLTWQPNVKPVTYYTPEFLTYYAQQQVVVKCLAHIAEGNETTVTLATISADTCVTIPVQYAIIAGLTNALPQWYDVWVETGGGTRLTYKQRYYAQDMRSEQEQWILFENSLGGIDTFRAYGDSDNTAEHTHNVAEIEEVSQEYRVDTERKYKKSTGRLDRNERLWLLDFFPSTRKYIYIGQSLRQIVVVESDVNYKASELPSSYTFTYRYADAKPYLNLPRTDVPLEVLDIQVPDVGSFTVAPRLVEFPSTPLSDGALFPVQDPYSEEWGTTTFGAIRQIIAAMVSTAEESFAILTHTHLNKSFLDGLSWDSIRNHFAQSFLSKTNADTANGVITFAAGLVSNAIAWFKQGIKIGSSADSTMGIDASGNATLNNVTAGGHVTSPDLRSDEVPNDDNIGGSGYHVYKDANGNGHVCTDYLDVRKKARFTELEIRRLSYINADQVQSMAASKVEKVLPIAADGTVISSDDTTTTVVAYRCLAVADDGSTATKNGWALGDQARCQTFNISTPGNYQNVENRFYWRLVVRVGQCYDDGTIYPSQEEHDGKVYHFFDLANIMDVTADAGDEFDDFFAFADEHATEDVYEGYMITLVNNERTNLNDIPATEDAVVQMGNRIDTDRMGFFVTKADNLNTGPYIYAGVNQFSLVNKMITKITPAEVLISARKLKVFSDPNAGDASPLTHYRGDWTQGSTSYYYDEWDYQGSRWLCLYQGAEGITCAPGEMPSNAPQGATVADYWKEISLKGDSVKIAGYAEYYYGDSSRPKPASPSVDGDIALLDYPDNSDDMIDVGVIDDMETLSGYWDGQSVPYGTCYIYRPNKHLYEATESGWRDLGKFVGDDGNGILSITRTYGISAQSTTASETTAPSDISSWASNSPAVTEAKPFLWAKEVVVYTKASTTTKYYCIGARGDNGIDAKDAEWAYIRTKTNVPPVIDSDSSYTDSNSKTCTDDDHLPKVVPGTGGSASDIEDDNSGNPAKKYECTDDPQGVTSEWKYEWEIKREKGNADSSGHRAWSAYSGEMTIHTMWAASPIIADLDNEMDSVACNTQGHPVQISGSNQVVSTNVSLMNGSTSVTPSSIVVRDTNSSGTQYGSGQTAQNGIKVTITGQKIDVEFTTSATIDGKKVFYIALTGTVNGASVTRELYFTVNGVRPGANGEPATIYNIIPSPNDIAFSRLASGGLTPDKQYLTFTVKKTVGDSITELLSGQMYNSDKLKLKYSTSAPPSSDYSDGTEWGSVEQGSKISFSYGTATIPNSVAFSSLYLALFKEITNGNSTSYTLLDRETIPVIKDGANGADGNDGDDGLDAWTLTVNPSPIIIEQNIEDGSFPFSTNSPLYIDMTAKCGDNAATVDTPLNPSSNGMGLTVNAVNAVNSGNHRLKITAYNKDSQTNKYITNGYITCDVPLSYGTRSTTMAVRIEVGVNLLGEWETKIVGDAETSVATKLTNAVIDGEINTFQQVGTYIRSASENTAKLTETIGARSNGNNLFGFSKGVRFGTFIPFVQGYGIVSNTSADTQLHQAWVNNLGFDGKTGYYVVTCEAKMLGGSSKDVTFSLYGTGTNDNPSSVTKTVGTTWTKLTMVFYIASFADSEASRNGQFYINNIPDTNRIAIRKLQIEHGSVPSDFGVCKEDEMAASVPVSIDWSVPSAFTKASSGGPDGGECYYNNTHPASGSSIEINAFNISLPYGVYTMSFWAKANVDEYTIQCICCDVNNYDTNVMPDLISGEYGVMESYQESGMNKYGSVNIKLSTQWRKYYVPYYLASAGNMYIVPMRINYGYTGGSSGTFYISKIKFEKGYVTSSNRTEYQTVMKQTARRMDFSVLVNSMEKAGIHLYTSNKTTPESEDEIDEGIIDIVAGKVRFVDPNGNPYASPKVAINPTTGVFETVDARLSGNLYTPYKRLTSSNISSYRLTNFAGETVVNLSSTGLNLQVEVAVELRLPEITADMLGCEVNIFNATTSMLTITGSGNTTSSSSDKYCANLIIPSTASNLGTNGSVGLQKYREAKFKAVYTGYSSIQQYAWLCCFANINP